MPVDPNNPRRVRRPPGISATRTITDLSHNAPTFLEQFDNGKMDGFVSALNTRNQNGRMAMGYYDSRDIPYYWNLAANYVLFDHFFSSAKDGSFANHMYWVAATFPQVKKGQNCRPCWRTCRPSSTACRLPVFPGSFMWKTITHTSTTGIRPPKTTGNRRWSGCPCSTSPASSTTRTLSSHIVDLSQYYLDLQQGTLPAVAYIVPSGASEHPPDTQPPANGL